MSQLMIDEPEYHAKSWGREIWIANNNKYCGKILEFNPGCGFSVHFHVVKDETFCVLDNGLILNGIDKDTAVPYKIKLKKGAVIHIKPGMVHQIWNEGDSIARIIEVSTQHFESDSYRTTREKIL